MTRKEEDKECDKGNRKKNEWIRQFFMLILVSHFTAFLQMKEEIRKLESRKQTKLIHVLKLTEHEGMEVLRSNILHWLQKQSPCSSLL